MCRDATSSHPYTFFSDNRLMIVHPSSSREISTQSENAFWEERITDSLRRVAAKDTISAVKAFVILALQAGGIDSFPKAVVNHVPKADW